MIRAYRFAVTVYIEGEKATLPAIHEIAEHVATQVQDADDHDLATHVVPIETEDYPWNPATGNPYPKTKATTTNPRPRRKQIACGDRIYKDPVHPKDGQHTCRLPIDHEGDHIDTSNPMHPSWTR
jgi:hypothetical protein